MKATLAEATRTDSDEWLARLLGDVRRKTVADHPWARTERVRSERGVYYLKVLPETQRAGMPTAELLGRRFPDAVPEVAAYDFERGFLLLRDHAGRDIGGDAETRQRIGVLRTYARLQAGCVGDAELLDVLPRAELHELTDEFLRFLSTEERTTDDAVGAAHFLGNDRALFYRERFRARAGLLQEAVIEATRLPTTVNHCDLRMQNTAETDDGRFVLFDWDEVVAGPAGMSLHHFFSGCSALAELTSPDADDVDARRALSDAYVEALAEAGYADRERIRGCLSGAACAGVLRYLMSYGKFPAADEADRRQVANILVRRLDDLLAFCDLRAVGRRAIVEQLADDYEESDAPEHAKRLLVRQLVRSPDDAELQVRLGHVYRYLGDAAAAERHCRTLLESDPSQAEVRCLLGRILLDRSATDDAVEQLRLASAFAPDDESIRRFLADAASLQELERHAARPGCVPVLRFSAEERAAGTISRAKRRLAGRLFHEYGTLIVENVFDAALMDRLAASFEERYRPYLNDDRPDDALQVGNRRFMITVDVADGFNDGSLYAAPLVTPILERLLGEDFILGSFTAVTSLPGAADMRMHKDHPALFRDEELPVPLPTVGVTTLVPLKGFDLTMGTTRVVKGSHRRSSDEAAAMEWQDPCAPKGSCLLMDYRLSHQGRANRSQAVRPVLSMVYSRPWFRDCVNYELQEPLRISRGELERVAEPWRRLFSWTRPQVERAAEA